MNQKQKSFLYERRPTLKLAATYLAVIMTMSIIFSFILFFTSVHGFEKRPTPPDLLLDQRDPDHVIDEWLGRRAVDNSNELALRLVLLNTGTLLVGACLSYFLARKTLQPIEKSMQEQERFIADASHELRTPITAILLDNEVALRQKDLKMADARQLIQQNVEDIKELKALSDELLDVSVDKKVPHIKLHDLKTIVDTAIKNVEPLAKTKHIEITLERLSVQVATDDRMLAKIVVILLDNAIKYSPEKTKVSVSAHTEGKWLKLMVTDEGSGIISQDIDHIFERFYRADSSRSQTSGHGLGLSIAAKLAAKLGAKLSVESRLSKGSTFVVRLSV